METTYSRRDFLKNLSCGTLGIIAGAAALSFPGCTPPAEKMPPNILLIMADDMGYSDIGCYGGEIRTPNLDRLAADGVRFTRFYNTARCCPTRASLLTGLYSHQAGVGHMMADRGLPGYKGDLQPNCITIAEGLKQAGYSTYMSGKWHVTRFIENDGPKHNWPLHALEEDIARYKGRYDAGWDALREERFQRMLDLGLIQPDWPLSERDPRVPPWEEAGDKAWHSRRMEVYAAQVDRMDQGIGRILAQLEKSGDINNTLIFFLADNGGCAEEITESWLNWLYNESEICPKTTRDGKPVIAGNDPAIMPGPPDTFQSYGIPWANVSNTPFRLYKHWSHEGGVATPLIMHWPAGIKTHGEFRDHPGHLIDIMATCMDVSGALYPAEFKGRKITPMEGRSLMPAVENQPSDREALFFEHEGNRAVIEGKWKLVADGPEGAWELYDLNMDRTETRNLAAEHPDQVERLAGMWDSWARRAHVIPWPWNEEKINE